MEQETWKSIKGYENYEVSDLGRIKSLNYRRTGVEKILKPVNNGKDYFRVELFRNKKCKKLYVHRLVAEAFIPNPMGLPEINHKDENPSNNVVSNLEWCDCKYNINYGHHNERMAATLSKPVEASKYEDFRKIYLRFSSTMESYRNGYNFGAVAACCRGCYNREGNNKYRGLFWRFAV